MSPHTHPRTGETCRRAPQPPPEHRRGIRNSSPLLPPCRSRTNPRGRARLRLTCSTSCPGPVPPARSVCSCFVRPYDNLTFGSRQQKSTVFFRPAHLDELYRTACTFLVGLVHWGHKSWPSIGTGSDHAEGKIRRFALPQPGTYLTVCWVCGLDRWAATGRLRMRKMAWMLERPPARERHPDERPGGGTDDTGF